MKAVFCPRYGPPDILELRDVPRPEPRDGEVLVRVRATPVNTGDCRIRGMNVPPGMGLIGRLALGLTAPRARILGTECAGDVAAVGPAITAFRPGDPVFGVTGTRFRAHAEYVLFPARSILLPKPAALSNAQACSIVFGGHTALYFLRDRMKLAPGSRILINGASGSVGIAAVQLARHFGSHVTAVCSTPNIDFIRALGAHDAIDYSRADPLATAAKFDAVFDTVGVWSFAHVRRVLTPSGLFAQADAGLPQFALAAVTSLTGGHRLIAGVALERHADVALLFDLVAQSVLRPVVDSVFPLDRAADAHRRVESRRKRGTVILAVNPP